MKLLFVLATAFLLSGCATILYGPKTVLSVRASRPARLAVAGDTLVVGPRSSNWYVPRSRQDLPAVFFTDSVRLEENIPTQASPAYVSNIFFNYGLGMFVDRRRIERWAYPRRIFWDVRRNRVYYGYREPPERGTFRWALSFPYLNHFQWQPDDSLRTRTGFLGIGTGVEYYYRPRAFGSLHFGTAIDFPIPFPAGPIDFVGPNEHFSAVWLRAKHHHGLGRFDLAYGLHFTRHRWRLRDYGRTDAPLLPDRDARKDGLGLCLSANYRWGRRFYTELNYQPALWTTYGQNDHNYQHLVSLEIGWKFRVR